MKTPFKEYENLWKEYLKGNYKYLAERYLISIEIDGRTQK